MKKNKIAFKNKIQTHIPLFFLFIIIFLSLLVFVALKHLVYPVLLSQYQKRIEATGEAVVSELYKKISVAQTLSVAMAEVVKTIPRDKSVFKRTLSDMLNIRGYRNIIAGGGYWPEPFYFDKHVKLRSFFWGRQKNGKLTYYNDYNKCNCPGYLHEEWYVPVKYLLTNNFYWSKSYVDPYSKQPMVTCSAPVYVNENFTGVTTVDLKLDGLAKLFNFYGKKLGGYIFVLDRNNKFMSFPNERYINRNKQYISFKEFSEKYKFFNRVTTLVDKIDRDILIYAKKKFKKFSETTQKIASESYQINYKEAQRIMAVIVDPIKYKDFKIKNSLQIVVGNDLILKEKVLVSIFIMPKTYWKIFVVTPFNKSLLIANNITADLVEYFLIGLILIIILTYFLLHFYIIKPLGIITKNLMDYDIAQDRLRIDYNSDNEIGKLVYYFNKLTDALKRSEKYSRAIFEQSPVSIQIYNKNGVAIEANKAWENMWNVKSEYFNGKYNILKDKVLRKTPEFAFIKKAFKGESHILTNTIYSLKTETGMGEDKVLNVVIFPIIDNNEVFRVVVMQQDITELYVARKELEYEKELLKITLESIDNGILITDITGKIEFVNREAQRLIGCEAIEIKDSLIENILKIFDRNNENVLAFVKQGDHLRSYDFQEPLKLLSKNGKKYDILLSCIVMKSNQEVFGAVFVFKDITVRLLAEKELQKMDKLESLGMLAGGIAHDFNNILTTLYGNISILKYKISSDAEEFKFLNNAEKSIHKAKSLTTQLLTFSKGGEPLKENFDICALIKEVGHFCMTGSGIKLNLVFSEQKIIINADKGQISQVITNLLINAKQAMNNNGNIYIYLSIIDAAETNIPKSDAKNFVKITVKDEGRGIPAENIDKIFDPYFSTKSSGHGLGLASSFLIIDKHNGLITVESQEGEGSVFNIYLPLENSEKTGKNQLTKNREIGKSIKRKGLNILLIDDDPEIINAAKDMLEILGNSVAFAFEGESGIEKYKKAFERGEKFDVVILDLTIVGGKGGKDTIKELLQIDPHIIAVVSSGYSEDPVMSNFKDYGFKGRLVKPYLLGDLEKVILQVTGKYND